mgnify:CR=1 FL=1
MNSSPRQWKIGKSPFLLEESSAEETDIWIDRAVTEMGSIAGDERRGESKRRDVVDEPEDNELPGDNDIDFYAEWSDTYKVACQCLYGSDEKEPDFKEASVCFRERQKREMHLPCLIWEYVCRWPGKGSRFREGA